MRPAPFHGFLHLRAGGVDKLAQVVKDRLGKIGCAGNIRVHAAVSFGIRFRGHTFRLKVAVSIDFDKQKMASSRLRWFSLFPSPFVNFAKLLFRFFGPGVAAQLLRRSAQHLRV